MALKRVCDITGTDRDVEICDVTIAGQTIKLDLAPAGAEKLRDFFGPVVTVQHPRSQGADSQIAAAAADDEDEDEDEAAQSQEAEAQSDPEAEDELAPPAAAYSGSAGAGRRPARPGRRGAAPKNAPKGGRNKAASRRAVQAVVPGTSEIREWARANGFEIGERGAIPGRIRSAYTLAHE